MRGGDGEFGVLLLFGFFDLIFGLILRGRGREEKLVLGWG